jgi:hypothetical protein
MKKIVIFSKSLKIFNASDFSILYLKTGNELVYTLVGETDIQCLIYDMEDADKEAVEKAVSFLKSVKLNFPLLAAGVILPGTGMVSNFQTELPGFTFFKKDDAGLNSKLIEFIKNSRNNNQRESNRFSWPLNAYFTDEAGVCHSLEIFSISAGGAYLKSTKLMPRPGTAGHVKIEFHNFEIESKCIINDSQTRSSNYPFGFSIRFAGLNEKAGETLKKIIDDAIIKILLDPTAEPEVPSLDSEELSIDSFTL